MGREFELKFWATEEQLEAIRQDIGGFSEIQMETTYYDVPERTLRKLLWTFRKRMENDVSVCTLKTNIPEGGRGEWEVTCPQIIDAVPKLIEKGAPAQLAEITRNGVVPICGARFTRLARKLPAGSGTVELALDQGVLIGGGHELPFVEIEVELKEGTDRDAILFAEALSERYELLPEYNSKISRALTLNDAP